MDIHVSPEVWGTAAAFIGVVGVIAGALINKFNPFTRNGSGGGASYGEADRVIQREAIDAMVRSAQAMEMMGQNLRQITRTNHEEHLNLIRMMENNHRELMDLIAPRRRSDLGDS